MKIFRGISVSGGIVIGKIMCLSQDQYIKRYQIEDIEVEKRRFDNAVAKVSLDLDVLMESFSAYDEAAIFAAHKAMVNDKVFCARVHKEIDNTRCNAEAAVWMVIEEFAANFKGKRKEFDFRVDMYDVAKRLISALQGTTDHLITPTSKTPQIAIAYNLTASDVIHLHKKGVKALASEGGSYISHSAILARAFNMPYVVNLHNIYWNAQEASLAIIDGNESIIILDPDEPTITAYKDKCHPAKTSFYHKKPKVKSKDERSIEILANAGLLEEIAHVKEYNVGIGLFRTEFLYAEKGSLPTEAEQFEIYKKIVSQIPQPVTIRTFDLSYAQLFGGQPTDICMLRGIRLMLHYEKLFREQLSALLRASEYGNLRILLPLVTTKDELIKTKEILDEIESQHQKLYHYKLGAMVETPAAALSIDQLCNYVDFLSIGTNDLLQYTFVINRAEQQTKHLSLPFEPSFLRLLKNIVDVTKEHGKQICVCGELAAEPLFVPIFLVFGLDELSVPLEQINKIKCLIDNLDSSQITEWIEHIMQLQSAQEIQQYLKNRVGAFME